MKTIRVEVTQEDIGQGVPNNACSCPVALAVRKLGYENVAVHQDSLDLNFKDLHADWLDLPPQARIFVAKFDARRTVEPFGFEIEVPE